ncbi:outer membrane protein [Jannaschia pohangensis]|uniref:Opacity protein n=1 Tax=Jannaschia pohangensis TaxID=390807 RepID=A0A1I3I1Y1_9RHOB|nr:outer membrane beta-barrel protein [Jannaschia pohangensis]SFI42028.1 Opacity protein [Jannaschia pohangensis]
MKRHLTLMILPLLATPAFAGNIAPPPAPLEPAPVFVDPAPVGYDWSGFSVGAQIGYADANATGGLEGEGAIGGLRANYDLDLGNWVVGAGIDYDTTNIDLSGAATVDNVLRVKGRAGIDGGRNLYYATAGYAQAETDLIGDGDGYFAGLGYEVFVTDQLTVGTEVLYHEFDDFDGAPGVEADATTAQVSLNWRF